jgi:restriction endonuclease
LTVIATESYEEFADHLQKEIEADTGIRFGIVEQHQFATIAITTADGKVARWAWTSRRRCGTTCALPATSTPRARCRIR